MESLMLSPTGSTCSQVCFESIFFFSFLAFHPAYHTIAVIFHSSHVAHLFVKPIISLPSPVELSLVFFVSVLTSSSIFISPLPSSLYFLLFLLLLSLLVCMPWLGLLVDIKL